MDKFSLNDTHQETIVFLRGNNVLTASTNYLYLSTCTYKRHHSPSLLLSFIPPSSDNNLKLFLHPSLVSTSLFCYPNSGVPNLGCPHPLGVRQRVACVLERRVTSHHSASYQCALRSGSMWLCCVDSNLIYEYLIKKRE